jgi:hypothetical protein
VGVQRRALSRQQIERHLLCSRVRRWYNAGTGVVVGAEGFSSNGNAERMQYSAMDQGLPVGSVPGSAAKSRPTA